MLGRACADGGIWFARAGVFVCAAAKKANAIREVNENNLLMMNKKGRRFERLPRESIREAMRRIHHR